jgi:hypothetical protein
MIELGDGSRASGRVFADTVALGGFSVTETLQRRLAGCSPRGRSGRAVRRASGCLARFSIEGLAVPCLWAGFLKKGYGVGFPFLFSSCLIR